MEELKRAKRRGMDGFQLEVCIHPVSQELDYKELACINNYPQDPLVNGQNDRLAKTQCPRLHLWVVENQYESMKGIEIL